jgi:hypothetical protein
MISGECWIGSLGRGPSAIVISRLEPVQPGFHSLALPRTYDLYEMEDEKRVWFLKWEQEIAGIAKRVGVAQTLGVPASPPTPPSPALLEISQVTTAHASPTMH